MVPLAPPFPFPLQAKYSLLFISKALGYQIL